MPQVASPLWKTQHQTWVEFVVHSFPYSEGFSLFSLYFVIAITLFDESWSFNYCLLCDPQASTEDRISICGQLIGMSHFVHGFIGSRPALCKLQTEKVATVHSGKYTLVIIDTA